MFVSHLSSFLFYLYSQPHYNYNARIVCYLFVGQGHYSALIASTIKILISPPQ